VLWQLCKNQGATSDKRDAISNIKRLYSQMRRSHLEAEADATSSNIAHGRESIDQFIREAVAKRQPQFVKQDKHVAEVDRLMQQYEQSYSKVEVEIRSIRQIPQRLSKGRSTTKTSQASVHSAMMKWLDCAEQIMVAQRACLSSSNMVTAGTPADVEEIWEDEALLRNCVDFLRFLSRFQDCKVVASVVAHASLGKTCSRNNC